MENCLLSRWQPSKTNHRILNDNNYDVNTKNTGPCRQRLLKTHSQRAGTTKWKTNSWKTKRKNINTLPAKPKNLPSSRNVLKWSKCGQSTQNPKDTKPKISTTPQTKVISQDSHNKAFSLVNPQKSFKVKSPWLHWSNIKLATQSVLSDPLSKFITPLKQCVELLHHFSGSNRWEQLT